MDDRGSSATVSERNAESLFDTQDDINVAGQDGDEKHVSWWGVQSDQSPEKGKSIDLPLPWWKRFALLLIMQIQCILRVCTTTFLNLKIK